jgi:hypothetical protein
VESAIANAIIGIVGSGTDILAFQPHANRSREIHPFLLRRWHRIKMKTSGAALCRKAMKRVQNGKGGQFYLFEGLGKYRGDFTFAGVGQ